ncbi:hypothetical protein BHT94_11780 [Bacillus licheniformis]|nr:hypothetical protein BHT94_11780 [Bacillus licheniformis]RPJ99721.1 hypothetical protein BSBH6_03733 [Bacillus subtilis]RPK20666.1 hypothetical protein BH5_03883 [Bacillus subtilis]
MKIEMIRPIIRAADGTIVLGIFNNILRIWVIKMIVGTAITASQKFV